MIERHIHNHLIWIDLQNPTNEEIREIMTEFELAPELVHDFAAPVPRSEAICVNKVIKLTMDFPVVRRTDMKGPHEMKFIVGSNFFITVHYESITSLDNFKKELEVVETLRKSKTRLTGADLYIALMNVLYESIALKLDYLYSKVSDIEAELYDGHEREMVFQISALSRRLITFKETLRAHDDVFRDAKNHFEHAYKTKYHDKLADLHMHYFHLMRRTLSQFETLEDFRSTNLELLSTRQNEIMKLFTILAFVTFPLTLFTSMFGMNTKTAPITGQDGDFWIILAIMTAIATLFFLFFKYKKWL
ncbi:magnesium transporter CorA family protein [bacterium]|nr:magnesium transporter CorA family protein [bacterium]